MDFESLLGPATGAVEDAAVITPDVIQSIPLDTVTVVDIGNLNAVDLGESSLPFSTNPSLADLGGDTSLYSADVAATGSFPSLETISRGISTILRLGTQAEVARAQVAGARAQAARTVPVSINPNEANFRTTPAGAQGYFSGVIPSGAMGVRQAASSLFSNPTALVVSAVIFVIIFLSLKR